MTGWFQPVKLSSASLSQRDAPQRKDAASALGQERPRTPRRIRESIFYSGRLGNRLHLILEPFPVLALITVEFRHIWGCFMLFACFSCCCSSCCSISGSRSCPWLRFAAGEYLVVFFVCAGGGETIHSTFPSPSPTFACVGHMTGTSSCNNWA